MRVRGECLALAAAVLAVPVLGCATARPPAASGFLFRELHRGGRSYPWVLYVPRAYDPSHAWPLILFLHGSGESGADGSRQLAQGLPRELVWSPERWPALVVLPQKPTVDSEWEQHEAAVLAMVAEVRRAYPVDPDRIALTGLSQGGHGAWVLGARHSDLFTAVAPVCGYGAARRGGDDGGLPPAFEGTAGELAAGLAGVPVWAFHGAADDVVPPDQTRELVAAVTAAGGEARATIYVGVNHGSWERAYAEPELPGFLLTPRRRAP